MLKLFRRKHIIKSVCIALRKEFLDMTTKAQSIKEEFDKLDFLKINLFQIQNAFCIVQINTIKRQATNKKVPSDHISMKNFYLEYIKCLQFKNNKQFKNKQTT